MNYQEYRVDKQKLVEIESFGLNLASKAIDKEVLNLVNIGGSINPRC
jgi:hypothetical protein